MLRFLPVLLFAAPLSAAAQTWDLPLTDAPEVIYFTAGLFRPDGDSVLALLEVHMPLGDTVRVYRYSIAAKTWTLESTYGGNTYGAPRAAMMPDTKHIFHVATPDYAGIGDPAGPIEDRGVFSEYDPVLRTWTSRPPCPLIPIDQQALQFAMVAAKGGVYAIGGYDFNSEPTGQGMFVYTPAGGWARRQFLPNGVPAGVGTSLTYPGTGDDLYALAGWNYTAGTNREFFRYSMAGDSWEALPPIPEDVASGAALAGDGDSIYAFCGGGSRHFYRYRIFAKTWERLADEPGSAGVWGGAALSVMPGENLHALIGGNTKTFLSCSLATLLPDAPSTLGQYLGTGIEIPRGRGVVADGFDVRAVVADPRGRPIQLEVELKQVGVPFDGTGTWVGPVQDKAGPAVPLSIPLPGENVKCRWRARTIVDPAHMSSWTCFGTDPDDPDEVDLYRRGNVAPSVSALALAGAGRRMPLGGDGSVMDPDGIIFRGNADDGDRDECRFEIEVVAEGRPFGNVATASSSLASTGSEGSVMIPLGGGSYAWQVRGVDEHGAAGDWAAGGRFRMLPFGSLAASSCSHSAGGGLLILAAMVAGLLRRRI